MRYLESAPRFLFFTGKGGVGKTSVACATSVRLATRERRVLLVSTDPASNLGQVFGMTIGNRVTQIAAVPGLAALEIDPEQAAEAYRERIIGPLRGHMPEAEIAGITESLSGSCTTEIASFDEFTQLLTDDVAYGRYDHIIFDTAPTGHTLRLLQLPGAWTEFLSGGGDASCLGPLAGLDKHRATYSAAVDALTDPARTRLILVARPQPSALKEIERTYSELRAIGIADGFVVINGVLPEIAGEEPIARAVRHREAVALSAIPAAIADLPRDVLELKAANVVDLDALRAFFTPEPADTAARAAVDPADLPNAPLVALVDQIQSDGHGLVMCMGKGGVGKTTIAAAVALALAERGHEVLLTTTDPAANLTDTLGETVDRLTVARIDPDSALAQYRSHVMATKGRDLDEPGRAALAEDLMSPCTAEVAVFQQFSRAVHDSRRTFVVMDTAPTGHTLLLLDAAGSYHREIARQMGAANMAYSTPLMRLQDPAQTKVILVTLAETTPVLEAADLQGDLERAGIHPWAWVVNSSIAAAHPRSAFLRTRARNEVAQIERVRELADRLAIVPLLSEEPIGVAQLAALTGGMPQLA
ncbi:arsenical pump-driving ATPase [Microbacterium rhizosphaerae]|uniref:Arsenical pump-driving ATPase n=1 Tax=Microbacterium rhizosphaerae TaxID=1678237 RepID=A0ABZ0SK05_9MICO|nr:arsenical pump-driving ATPase [Microbacterium rhizosphaerae]WPR88948.1 arsenical pump-driving ATPase [Microbacterium rhizosphaerae]